MQAFQVLVAGIDASVRRAIPESLWVREVTGVTEAGLWFAEDGEPVALAPAPCLGLIAASRTHPLMEQVRAWMLANGATALPEILVIERRAQGGLVERALLDALLAETGALARSALRQARRVAHLRQAVETLETERAGLDRFLGETGLARMETVFATAEPDYETQIELVPGAVLRQLLPIASTGLAAIDVACIGGGPGAIAMRLVQGEGGHILARWRVPARAEDGWVRLGLPVALSGLERTLSLLVECDDPGSSCANLALGAFQPLPAAQLADAETSEAIAPYSLAMRLHAALPGTTPPHRPGTLLPEDADDPDEAPYRLHTLGADALSGLREEPAPREGEAGKVRRIDSLGAIVCRAGAQARLPLACPAGARGILVGLDIHAETPAALSVTVGIAGPEGRLATQALAAREEGDGAVSLLFPAPLTEPHDILLAATEPVTPPAPDAWAVFRDLRVYL